MNWCAQYASGLATVRSIGIKLFILANRFTPVFLSCSAKAVPFLLHFIPWRGFGGLEVACWPLIPKFAGSSPAEAVGFLRVNKNPQHVGGHVCLSVVIVVCCQVEVSATN